MAPNLPRPIAAALASGRATLLELMTFYSVEDCALINEVAAVDNYNTHLVNQAQAGRNAG